MSQKTINIAQPMIDTAEQDAVLSVLQSGILAQGKYVHQFEENFAQFIGTNYAVATSNGTTALHLALLAAGVGAGDEVITTPFSFIASANAIIYTGATPVFADTEYDTFGINPKEIEKKITKKTKAILPVHLYGLPANMPALIKIGKKYNIPIIEDACQAHGAAIKKKRVGSYGVAGCFSFYPTKNMTTGEGGMVTTNSKKIAEKVKLLREHGMKIRYYHDTLGYNFRMTNIAAAIGIEQLKKLQSFNEKRIANAKTLSSYLSQIKGLVVPTIPKNYTHVFHQYTIKITKEFGMKRDEVITYLNQNNIATGVYYPVPIHKQKPYKKLGYTGRFPTVELLTQQVISLPIHPGLSWADLKRIRDILKSASKKN